LNIDLENHGIGGCSNQTIFDNFLRCVPQIKPNDYVIFQWTDPGRFRIATEANFFRDITGSITHPPQNDDVSNQSTSEIAINRSTYSVYWTEIENYIKTIKMILKNNPRLNDKESISFYMCTIRQQKADDLIFEILKRHSAEWWD